MKLIVGLGNPGNEYRFTRHNAGFMVVDEIAKKDGVDFRKSRHLSFVAKIKAGRENICLIKPLTYMNLSGKAVRGIKESLKIKTENLLIIHDDADLCVGNIRFYSGGSIGGHNGLKSIMEELGTKDFQRLRIGIGRTNKGESLEDYVLKTIDKVTASLLLPVISLAAEAAVFWASCGIDKAMNKFNVRN